MEIEITEMGTGETFLVADYQTPNQIQQPTEYKRLIDEAIADPIWQRARMKGTDHGIEATRSMLGLTAEDIYEYHRSKGYQHDYGHSKRRQPRREPCTDDFFPPATVYRVGQGKKPLPPPPIIRYGPPGEDWKLGWNDCTGEMNHHYIRVWYGEGTGLTACEQFVTHDGNFKRKDRKICPSCQRLKG